MLKNNPKLHTNEMIQQFPIVRDLDSTRFFVLANLASIIGVPRLAGFKKMWAAIERNDYEVAANEILDSNWGRQSNELAVEWAQLMKSGI
jgi:lysozyme